MFKNLRAFTALIVSVALLSAAIPTTFGAETETLIQAAPEQETITAEKIVSESVINYFNMNRLLYKGNLENIDLSLNESTTVNSNLSSYILFST